MQGFAYKENGMNVVLFANSLTNKVHQRDEYAYISNFLFSSVLSDKNYDGSASLPFTDVADDAYYADAVVWAVAKNITSGATATTFDPDGKSTREQSAAILYRYAGSPAASSSALNGFADQSAVSSYAVTAMQWAVGSGLIQGKPDGVLDPQGTATRAEIAAMLHRFLEK